MQVQMVNRRATAEYANFEAALYNAGTALEDLKRKSQMIRRPSGNKVGWTIPTKSEVNSSIQNGLDELDTLKKAAKKYKTELLARGWRV